LKHEPRYQDSMRWYQIVSNTGYAFVTRTHSPLHAIERYAHNPRRPRDSEIVEVRVHQKGEWVRLEGVLLYTTRV
jgi:hypothetical protein